MTDIEEILSRALLVRNRTMPRDTVPHAATPPGPRPVGTPTRGSTQKPSRGSGAAAENLRALCETLISHTPPTTVAKFVTEQVPEPHSALVLACVLQLTDTDDGARFWWQYAAGAGQAAAAYCLYLHHLALGERDTADWWRQQTDDVQPPPESHVPGRFTGWHPADHRITGAPTTYILRILRDLAKSTARPRPAAVSKLMSYIPTAVTAGYLREPDTELPLPGVEFARRINALLAAADQPDIWESRPHHPSSSAPDTGECPNSTSVDSEHVPPIPEQMGTAKR